VNDQLRMAEAFIVSYMMADMAMAKYDLLPASVPASMNDYANCRAEAFREINSSFSSEEELNEWCKMAREHGFGHHIFH